MPVLFSKNNACVGLVVDETGPTLVRKGNKRGVGAKALPPPRDPAWNQNQRSPPLPCPDFKQKQTLLELKFLKGRAAARCNGAIARYLVNFAQGQTKREKVDNYYSSLIIA